MARSFAAGDFIQNNANQQRPKTVAFWFRTSATNYPFGLVGKHNVTSSNLGWGVYCNTGGVLTAFGRTASANSWIRTGTTVVNDGAWHHFAINIDVRAGQNNSVYVDGALEFNQASGALWGDTLEPLRLGRLSDLAWNSFVGDMAEVGQWGLDDGDALSAADILSLARGFSPSLIRPDELVSYMPLIRSVQDVMGDIAQPTASGTTPTDHPRVIG